MPAGTSSCETGPSQGRRDSSSEERGLEEATEKLKVHCDNYLGTVCAQHSDDSIKNIKRV